MKQAVMTAPGMIEIRQAAPPTPQENEVVMQTRRIGVCGSDIHVFHGLHPYTTYPVVQGHEVGGVIAEVGSKVNGLKPGDKITFMPQITCGTCYPCTHGMAHICESLKVMGFQSGGAAQEFFALPAENVIVLPDNFSLDQAAMIEPIAVCVHALARGGGAAGRRVLVLGAGTIGNLTAQVAKASGADAVMITDVSDYKLAKARECGIHLTVNPGTAALGAELLRHFGAAKADLILECVGVESTITDAVNHARKGTTIVVVGVFGKKPQVDLGLVQDRELSLVGTLMYQKPDYERAVELVSGGSMKLDPLVTHRFRFDDYLAAYQAIEASKGEYLKVMVEFE
jgi:L-iditol 2-dehydrogenase